MTNGVKIAFQKFYEDYRSVYNPSPVQDKAAFAIMHCKTGRFGVNTSICEKCSIIEYHHNSCRNRNCPSCQAVLREIWIDNRNSEIIDAPYFHVVFTVPHELNTLFYANQTVLYSSFQKVVSKTLIQLSEDKKFLGATPGIIQILHTWGQKLNYHPHVHCIVTGAGLTGNMDFVKGKSDFFIPVRILSKVFRGKFICELQKLFCDGRLVFPQKLAHMESEKQWGNFVKTLYANDWIPFVKETFKQFGNAVKYLGRYSHRIAISNSRIISVSDEGVSFRAKDYRDGSDKIVTLNGVEFIRRFLMHVLPKGFEKIRHSGFLSNRCKARNLKIISNITGKIPSAPKLKGMDMAEIVFAIWEVNIRKCPVCNSDSMKPSGIRYNMRN